MPVIKLKPHQKVVIAKGDISESDKKLFQFLIENGAKDLRTLTYGDCCAHLDNGSDGLAIRFALRRVKELCEAYLIPRANLLVCNKTRRPRRPGRWVMGSTSEAEWRVGVLEVYEFNWDQVVFE